MGKLQVAVANSQDRIPCDEGAIESILASVLAGKVETAEISVAVVSDDEIAELNRRFLGRDGTTDVLAFPYASENGRLEGEIVINADEAVRRAEDVAHDSQDELMLYAVHGLLHLLGCDDAEPDDRRRMHQQALDVLARAGRRLDPESLLED